MRDRRRAAFAAALLAATVVAGPLAAPAGARPGRHARPPALPFLRAVRGDHARIVDSHGRQVLLRGVNVNQLADYYRKGPHPPSAPLLGSDYVSMRRLGFDVVRLALSWSQLEPAPGVFSTTYLAQIRQAVAWAKAQGIYTLIDMHQDAWGKYVAAAPGETCPPGMEPNIGWDGAPQWATLDNGLPHCNTNNIRELSPSVAQSFQSFYSDAAGPDGVGIQTHLLRTWRRLATAFAREPAVMGYDLLNEPHPGFTATGGEEQTIGAYYRRAIAAIREVDGRHMILVEPQVLRSALSDGIHMWGVAPDSNLLYAPHIYADRNGFSPDGTGKATPREWDNAEREAQEAGGAGGALPLWIGEFGALDPPARDAYNAEFMTLADDRISGWAHWVWKETCGDPHSGYGPFPDESMNAYDCATGRFTGLKRNRVLHYSRPFPVFAPGLLDRLSFDEGSRRFELRGSSAVGAHPLRLFIPLGLRYGRRLTRVRVGASGLRRLRLVRCRDGTARLTAFPTGGAYRLVLTKRTGRVRSARPRTRRAASCPVAG